MTRLSGQRARLANSTDRPSRTVALLGNPNVGKTTLFNRLAGRRRHTSNFPGTTQEAHVATIAARGGGARGTGGGGDGDDGAVEIRLIDLPGVYSLSLNQSESSICRGVLEGSTAPEGVRASPPDAVAVVVDATNLPRNLCLAGEVLSRGLPSVVIVTMMDEARRRGLHLDADTLERRLGVPVRLVSNKTGEGLDGLPAHLARARPTDAMIPGGALAAVEGSGEQHPGGAGALERWADEVFAETAAGSAEEQDDTLTDRLDRAFTHPVLGVVGFAAVMTGLFWVIYRLAAYPMDWIDAIFAGVGGWVHGVMPAGAVRDLLADGVIAGVGGTVIFLPQIVLLFFLIGILEQTGYLARAAFVIDRVLRPFGLPGHAFVPLLSGHACAIPAIMSARGIPDRRHRLTTILVIPFMSCSARIPVYVLLTGLLFPGEPAKQALAFTGCYVLGIVAALGTAALFRGVLLRGRGHPMAMELPRYRLPSVVDAARGALHRGWLFVKKAGTVILAISIVLWWLGSYPVVPASAEAESLRADAALVAEAQPERAAGMIEEADRIEAAHASRSSFLGRIGGFAQPVFAPMGADRQLTVGILASFAAREVFVATVAVQVAGTDDAEGEGVFDAIRTATRDDGSPLFTPASAWAMLVFFVLAIQCLPTLVVTAREAGGWKWAGLQFGWMTAVAYGAATLTYAAVSAFTGSGLGVVGGV